MNKFTLNNEGKLTVGNETLATGITDKADVYPIIAKRMCLARDHVQFLLNGKIETVGTVRMMLREAEAMGKQFAT